MPTRFITIKIQITAQEVFSLWAWYGVQKHTTTASALLESVPTMCLQIAPGEGAVLVIRPHSTWLCRVSRLFLQFSAWKLKPGSLDSIRTGIIPTPEFPPALLGIQLEPVRYPDMTSSNVISNKTGDQFDHGHEGGCDTDRRALTQLFVLVTLCGFCHTFPELPFRHTVLLGCASPWSLHLCTMLLSLRQSWCHGTVGSVQSLVVQLISPTKVKPNLSLWSLQWNDRSTPPHIRFLSGNVSHSKASSCGVYPSVSCSYQVCKSLPHIHVIHLRGYPKIKCLTWKWQLQLSLKKEETSPNNEYNQAVQDDLGKRIYIINTKMILEEDGDCWDMLNQTAALKQGYTKMIPFFLPV